MEPVTGQCQPRRRWSNGREECWLFDEPRGEDIVQTRLKQNGLTATHLLTDHGDEHSRSGATITRDSEGFDEAEDIVALLPEYTGLSLELSVDIVEVASCRLCE